jgi:hypothetical protein
LAHNFPISPRMETRKPLPYWLSGGTETCEVCGQTYVLQGEYRCEGCDAAMCEHCIQQAESGEVFCAGCTPPAEEEG